MSYIRNFLVLYLDAASQRSQASVPDSGYRSNSSFNSTGSRSMSTQASQRSVADMFSPNTMRVTSQSRNVNSQQNSSRNMNSNSFNNSNNTRNMNGFNNSRNSAGSGNSRQPLAVVTGNSRNSGSFTGSNFNQSGSSSNNTNPDGENQIVCNCGNDAVQLTVRKEGPNTGNNYVSLLIK